jgi:small subunit ribosomal protein S3
MGQKTNPIGLRVAVNKDWRSKWYAGKKEFGKLLTEDRRSRLLKKKLESASVPKILIERAANRCRITISPPVPASSSAAKAPKSTSSRRTEQDDRQGDLRRHRRGQAARDRRAVGRRERRAAARTPRLLPPRHEEGAADRHGFRREGIKIRCAGRLGGAELARVEQYHWGRVPLHTLRANIDYGFAEANTVYGKLGIKCWICKGEKPSRKPPARRSPRARRSPLTLKEEDFVMPLMPERVKYRKMHRGNRAGWPARQHGGLWRVWIDGAGTLLARHQADRSRRVAMPAT